MLKAIKNFFSRNSMNSKLPKMSFPSYFFIRSDEASLEAAVDQIYNTKKFCRWVNFFPFAWAHFDQEYADVGCTGRFYFFATPFRYKVEFIDVIPNKRYKAAVSGLIKGEISGNFIQIENGVLFEHLFTFTAANWLVHAYYNLTVKPPHLPYMAWRYMIFKKNAIKDTQKN